MKSKIVVSALILVAAAALCIWYYVFQYSKTHHRDVESEEATAITAAQIVKAFETNESAANAKYLNKAIQLSGVILKMEKDQSGNTTITLKSGEPFANVLCTLKPGTTIPRGDSVIVLKGICTGFLSDVVLNDAIMVKLSPK